jgi:hypothetical protein
MRLLDGGQILELEQTIDDRTVYTAPFELKRYWKRSPDTPMLEYVAPKICAPRTKAEAARGPKEPGDARG